MIDYEAEYRQRVADRRAAYDATNGAGAWDRAMQEIRSGPTNIAIGPDVNDAAFERNG